MDANVLGDRVHIAKRTLQQAACINRASPAGHVHQINGLHREEGLPEIYFGIGLNTGRVMAALLGSDLYSEHTVIGEMRVYQGDPDWPDIVAVDIAWDRNGKHEGYTWRIDVLGIKTFEPRRRIGHVQFHTAAAPGKLTGQLVGSHPICPHAEPDAARR